MNGPVADRFGRRTSILIAVVIFTIGSAIQAGAISIGMIFTGLYYTMIKYIPLDMKLIEYRTSNSWICSWDAYNDCSYVHG